MFMLMPILMLMIMFLLYHIYRMGSRLLHHFTAPQHSLFPHTGESFNERTAPDVRKRYRHVPTLLLHCYIGPCPI